MQSWRLQSSLWVPHPPEQVFPFFSNVNNLQLLTPPWMSFQIKSLQPIDMHVGALIDYGIKVRGLPMKWRTRIARWEPSHAFADEQLHGPYKIWHHTHTFTPQDGGTVLGDDVIMRPKGGPIAPLVMKYVRHDVERIFEFRAEVMAERFDADPNTASVRWVNNGIASALVGAR